MEQKIDRTVSYYRRWSGMDYIAWIIATALIIYDTRTMIIGVILIVFYLSLYNKAQISMVGDRKKITVNKKDWKSYCKEKGITLFIQYHEPKVKGLLGENTPEVLAEHTEVLNSHPGVSNDGTPSGELSEDEQYNQIVNQMKSDEYTDLDSVWLDDKTKQILIRKKLLTPWKLYNYSDLIDYRPMTRGSHVSKHHRLTRGAVGGALFGGAGAIVGASTGGKEYDAIDKMSIFLVFKDGYSHEIKLIKASTKTSSFVYKINEKFMNKYIGALESVLAQNAATVEIQVTSPEYNETDNVSEEIPEKGTKQLRELKSLLDDGILTEDEFKNKKKQILDDM